MTETSKQLSLKGLWINIWNGLQAQLDISTEDEDEVKILSQEVKSFQMMIHLYIESLIYLGCVWSKTWRGMVNLSLWIAVFEKNPLQLSPRHLLARRASWFCVTFRDLCSLVVATETFRNHVRYCLINNESRMWDRSASSAEMEKKITNIKCLMIATHQSKSNLLSSCLSLKRRHLMHGTLLLLSVCLSSHYSIQI